VRLLALALVLLGAAPTLAGERPDFTVGREKFPRADAIILRHEQHFRVDEHGAVVRRERRWVKLLSRRAIREFADPRIDWQEGMDEVVVHAARTHLADGTVLPVPEYGYCLAAPNDVAGWPTWASWRQRIISFSGIEPGVVLELDHEVRSAPGAHPWLSADIRFDADHPVLAREVTVSVPKGTRVRFRARGAPIAVSEDELGDTMMFTWAAVDLPASRGEAQSLSWRERCPSLAFTTCPDAATWVGEIAQLGPQPGGPRDALAAFAAAAVGEETDVEKRIEKVVARLRGTWSAVDSPKTWRGHLTRSPAGAFDSGHGSPIEAASVLAACLGTLGLETAVLPAVDPRIWERDVPVDQGFAAAVVRVALGDRVVYVHPREGLLRNPGPWGGHLVLDLDEEGRVVPTAIERRGDGLVSALDLTGRVEIAGDGKLTGRLELRLTGLFFDPAGLRDAGAQKRLVEGLVRRLIPAADVAEHAVLALSDEELRVSAKLAPKALERLGEGIVLPLGDGPCFLPDVPLPLARSERHTAVRTRGALRERIDLSVVLPGETVPVILPARLAAIDGEWGHAEQTLTMSGRTVRLRRDVELDRDTIPADAFLELRRAVHALRSRILMVE
jgi:hypothetical protein